MSSLPPPRSPHNGAAASDPAAAYRHLMARRRKNRRWRAGLVALAVAVVGLAGATVGLDLAGHHRRPAAATSTTRPPASPGSSTTTTTPRSGNGPTITSLTPSTGSSGQTVTIGGSGLFSSNGQILAYFGTEVAPTACPTVSSCTVTVPPGSPGPETVTVVTDRGTSNGLTFTYR